MRVHNVFLFASFVASLAGCAGESDEMLAEEGMVDEVGQQLEVENALNPNALNPNALNPNALNPNALNPNALNPNSLDPSALSAIRLPTEGGVWSRTFVKYAVSCAFDTTQTFSFSWTDNDGMTRSETYRGLLGLATNWQNGPLSTQEQEIVSACLASRTNYYGTTVTISSRSSVEPLRSMTTQSELQEYSRIEGGFWGNVFAAQPYLMACHSSWSASYSRSVGRECATGHINSDGSIAACGMIQLMGTCNSNCSSLNFAGKYYPACTVASSDGNASTVTHNVITVGLR